MNQQTGETISVLCKCGKKLKAPASAVGKKAKCPKCGNVLVVQAPPPKQESDDFDALYDLAADSEKAAQQQDVAPRCPQCVSPMPPGAVLCTNCGYDTRSGKSVAAPAPLKAPPIGKPAAAGTRFDPAAAAAAEAAYKKQGKKKVSDAMAPQGSFLKGVGFSIGGALIGGIVWFLVAWIFKWELSIIALAVGALAGAGMQMGQEGYSTLGGITAAAITFVVMILAKIAVVAAVIIPILSAASELGDEYDERVVDLLVEREMDAKKIDKEDYTDDQYTAAFKAATKKLKAMPKSEYEALLKQVDAQEQDEELIAYVMDDILKNTMKVDPEESTEAQDAIAEKQAQAKIAKMSPTEKAAELKRLQAIEDAEFEKAVAEAKAKGRHSGDTDGETSGSSGAAVAFGFVVFLLLVFGWKSAIFMLGALFVAYRTAAGSVSG